MEQYCCSKSELVFVQANAVAKLNYLQMLGYDISWAGFNIIEVSFWCCKGGILLLIFWYV